MITLPALAALEGVSHGFTVLSDGTPQESLCLLTQIHSARVVHVAQNTGDTPKADAMVTATPGLALAIVTADCAPVLLADPEARVIGAAHAGWRGALAGVLENTVSEMQTLGANPARIVAGIGPCIVQASYEVGPEFPVPFLAHNATAKIFFKPATREGHFLFDLPSYVASRLKAAGLTHIHASPHDTLAEDTLFHSYRRNCLNGIAGCGRNHSIIKLEGETP